jgi:serine/threonine protein phosphatase 1
LRIYVVGDIHGRADALKDVLARIDRDLAARRVTRTVQVFLGDYVDRGPASSEVLDRLIERGTNHEILLLKGNHEAFFLDFFDNPAMLGVWRQNGGLPTLTSYGLKPTLNPSPAEQQELAKEFARVVPAAHRKLLAELPLSFRCGDYFFVHAGVRPGVALKDQKEEDLLWIREEFLFHERDFEKIIVHGHTPMPEPEIRSNRINLDIGAYATGKLACMVAEADTIGFI